jgi:thiol-disulfide isomerase/thioredoxin
VDRLSAVALAALAACGNDSSTPPPSRVESAHGGAKKAASTEAFCDVHTANDGGPMFAFPPLAAGSPPPTAAGHWRWVNLWATWCKPCVEEMPRIVRWQRKLAAAGHPVDLAFISVDKSPADVTAFRAQHADAPDSLLVGELDKQAAWLGSLGIDAGAPIPIHIFTSPSGHVRCVRAGGVREQDYAAIEQLLGE